MPIMNIDYNIKLLGIHTTTYSKNSAKVLWTALTSKIWGQAQDNYHRALNLESRIRYVNEVILTTAWYMTQILPPPPDCVRQMNAALSYFIWKGAIFKAPLSTLQQPKDASGRALIHIMAK